MILVFFGSLDSFTQKIISPDFIEWYNNQRVSNVESTNTYRITIETLSLKSIIILFF